MSLTSFSRDPEGSATPVMLLPRRTATRRGARRDDALSKRASHSAATGSAASRSASHYALARRAPLRVAVRRGRRCTGIALPSGSRLNEFRARDEIGCRSNNPGFWLLCTGGDAILDRVKPRSGSQNARQVLKKIADGSPDALPTNAAKESLERLITQGNS